MFLDRAREVYRGATASEAMAGRPVGAHRRPPAAQYLPCNPARYVHIQHAVSPNTIARPGVCGRVSLVWSAGVAPL